MDLKPLEVIPCGSSPAPGIQHTAHTLSGNPLYCGGIDQLISPPLLMPNGSLVKGSPDRRTGRAWNRIELAPAVSVAGNANVEVSPPATNPRRMACPSLRNR